MSETTYQAYDDGDIVPSSEVHVSVDDPGFQWGYNIYDLLITVNHEPYDLDEHVARTFDSCRAAHMPIELSPDELKEIIEQVVEINSEHLGEREDFMVWISVSGGWNTYEGQPEKPRVIVHVTPIPFASMAKDFIDGKQFVTTTIRQLSPESISPRIKHRSRMHFVLADIEAKQQGPDADPLLLDQDGNVTETAIGNVFIVDDGVLRTPPTDGTLPGITQSTTLELARETLEIPTSVEQLQLYDVYNADEVFWTNTSHFVTPITKVDGKKIGTGRPGPVTERILDAHSDRAGIDIVKRYLSHLDSEEQPDKLQLGGDQGVSG